jgi:hypothetical protein
MKFWRRRFIRWSALAFAVGAISAPAAQAQVYAEGGGSAGNSAQAVTKAPSKPVSPVVSTVDEFSWSDAGVGAAGALAVVLLGSGVLLVARGTRTVAVDS